MKHVSIVAPFAGAWIEIIQRFIRLTELIPVAPFAGAWIEMAAYLLLPFGGGGRSLRGSVD